MMESRGRYDWRHTAHVLCMLANTRFGGGKHTPDEFYPYKAKAAEGEGGLTSADGFALLKGMFGKPRRRP